MISVMREAWHDGDADQTSKLYASHLQDSMHALAPLSLSPFLDFATTHTEGLGDENMWAKTNPSSPASLEQSVVTQPLGSLRDSSINSPSTAACAFVPNLSISRGQDLEISVLCFMKIHDFFSSQLSGSCSGTLAVHTTTNIGIFICN